MTPTGDALAHCWWGQRRRRAVLRKFSTMLRAGGGTAGRSLLSSWGAAVTKSGIIWPWSAATTVLPLMLMSWKSTVVSKKFSEKRLVSHLRSGTPRDTCEVGVRGGGLG